jgi:catechol 2,3-dioxygenase-like lactoylglutathione lyase family enzyme
VTRMIAALTLLVRDYDEAILWYRSKLCFETVEDTDLGGGKRWIAMAPPGGRGARLVVAKAATPEQLAAVGRQAGGRVAFFLETDDFARDHAAMIAAGVHFRETPRHELYGSVAVFEDLYGNGWDLLEPKRPL